MDMLSALLASVVLSMAPPLTAARSTPPCFARVNQPAASLRLNRAGDVADRVCYQTCEARLVGLHRDDDGMTSALAIYTGRRCS